MMYKVQHRILTVHEKQYHVFDWGTKAPHTATIKNLILNVLKENEVLYYQMDDCKVYTNDNGYFHVQMELVNDIYFV